MIRLLAFFAALICAAPAFAQQLPPGADPQNTLLIDTKYGRIVIKLRNDITNAFAQIDVQLKRRHDPVAMMILLLFCGLAVMSSIHERWWWYMPEPFEK